MPVSLETTTIRPSPAARMAGSRALVNRTAPNRFVVKISSKALAGISSTAPTLTMPALLTRP